MFPGDAGVKNLLAGEQQAAVTVAVEALMDNKQGAEMDGFATYDPKVGCLLKR
jgi:sec1 family domain-containing protein 1